MESVSYCTYNNYNKHVHVHVRITLSLYRDGKCYIATFALSLPAGVGRVVYVDRLLEPPKLMLAMADFILAEMPRPLPPPPPPPSVAPPVASSSWDGSSLTCGGMAEGVATAGTGSAS